MKSFTISLFCLMCFAATSQSLSNQNAFIHNYNFGNGTSFGEQPYLTYQHFDAGHPHIHIVSVKVTENGSRIDTQNIGRNLKKHAKKSRNSFA